MTIFYRIALSELEGKDMLSNWYIILWNDLQVYIFLNQMSTNILVCSLHILKDHDLPLAEK